MDSKCLRWGFFGAGRCTHDFVAALKLLPPQRHEIVAIAARDKKRGGHFSKVLGIKRSCESYLQLAQSPDIDIIYVGTVNSEHFAQAKMAIENGKSVLCEKPMSLNYKQSKEIIDLAKENKVFFMEGFWTFFFPATIRLFKELDKSSIGNIVHLIVEIGNKFSHLDRFCRNDIGGGSLLNHGVYGIMFAYQILGNPTNIAATGHASAEGGTDESAVITMTYKTKAQLATIILSSRADMPGTLKVIGTEGSLMLHFPFWAPHTLETPTGLIKFNLPKIPDGSIPFNNLNSEGFIYEAEEVRRSILAGNLESERVPWEASLAVMAIADEARRQIGTIYPQDHTKSI